MFLPRTSLPATPSAPAGWRRNDQTARLLSFAIIGAICTVAFALLYSAFRQVTGPIGANVGAFSATVGLNFVANRRLTFRAHYGRLLPQAAGYGAVYVVGLAASSGALWAALQVFSHPTGMTELGLAIGSGVFATVLRYLMLNRWVFRDPDRG